MHACDFAQRMTLHHMVVIGKSCLCCADWMGLRHVPFMRHDIQATMIDTIHAMKERSGHCNESNSAVQHGCCIYALQAGPGQGHLTCVHGDLEALPLRAEPGVRGHAHALKRDAAGRLRVPAQLRLWLSEAQAPATPAQPNTCAMTQLYQASIHITLCYG